ncbi:MAG: tRNA (adenosine(37)-N6)-threonylcarbamoyltransferase complex dimerization subunit type 1 TsaB [Natronospirillum sp.]|uniref:tRNA (adenosine(37)-N6)-threonylcarbamoyltransferase complex dimerization subunit type 1 TsaB n=1 Tax=Natronospirillum sp. TaxID=2812955 RepID=UPI0025D41F20|nr:tRNA (adenosine(37)-N6)-threonylcarbamoyltransferase complex dimerization subunit type 1 TsaB [Natronospirillum sp.]MCH8551436.1 tRNA (adenosine(37)-N6)-threonylcarbamoyltransferase complex dimerization subunit type 1 TsaB [Natronospirillum sp.]
MTRLLALDTTTEACSAALWASGELVAEERVIEPRGHTQRLLPMVESLLAQAGWALTQLDGIACTRGPGSFTGVRVGVSVAQGLAYAAELPVLSLSTLDVLAWQGRQLLPGPGRWQVAMDARMGELYTAGYRVTDAGLERVTEEALLAPDALTVWSENDCGRIGAGWALAPLNHWGSSVSDDLPAARHVASWANRLLQQNPGAWVTPIELQPVYLRDRVT